MGNVGAPGLPPLPPPKKKKKIPAIVRQLHEGQQSQVKHDGNGVKQGCVLAPTLFSFFFSIMLLEAKEDRPDGIYIRF